MTTDTAISEWAGKLQMGIGNVTYLFEKPNTKKHNSESFWSSLFALYILSISIDRSQHNKVIPAYRYQVDGDRWEFKQLPHKDSFRIPSGLSFFDVIIEGGINEQTFADLPEIDPALYAIKPDIIIQKDKRISIIEVKTTGRHPIGTYQKSLYEKLVDSLLDNGYEAELFFLISAGHESNRDWELLNKSETCKILLWEKVLEDLCNTNNELGRCLGNIAEYYEGVELKG